MGLSGILRLVLIIEIVILLGNAGYISRDYQDSWVLEGLEPYFAVFIITYAVAFFYEKKEMWMVGLAMTCCVTMVLIPNLKYVWFYGRSIDQQGQYRLANEVYAHGYISTQYHGGHAAVYVKTPLMHLSFAMFSIVLNIPVVSSIKILPALLSTLYPLLTYSILKSCEIPNRKTILKYALFISSIPIGTNLTYVITGSLFGILLVFFGLTQIAKLLQTHDRRRWVIFLIAIFALAASHSTSSMMFVALLSVISLLQIFSFAKIRSYLKGPTIAATVVVTMVWLSFSANKAFRDMINALPAALSGITPERGYIPSRFFELTSVNVLGALRSVIAYDGADVLLLLLSTVGLIFVLKTRKLFRNDKLKFLLLFNAVLLLLLVFGVFMRLAHFYWFRIVNFVRISYPIFSGIAVLYLIKRKTFRAVVFLSIMFFATIQFYGCQPLIPAANTISKDLPKDEPVVYISGVNSVYQRCMIEFAEHYVHGRIAADRVSLNQIIGLTQYDYSMNIVFYNPLARLVDKNMAEKQYDYFLIHLPGKSGAFSEPAEMRTRELILGSMRNSSTMYTNGESYVCVFKSS